MTPVVAVMALEAGGVLQGLGGVFLLADPDGVRFLGDLVMGESGEEFNRSFSRFEQFVRSAFASFVGFSGTFPLDFLLPCDIFDLTLDFVTVEVSDISVFVEDLFGMFQQSVENQS